MGAVDRKRDDSLVPELGALCEDVVHLAKVDGAALTVLTRSRRVRDLVYATDASAQQIDELQFTRARAHVSTPSPTVNHDCWSTSAIVKPPRPGPSLPPKPSSSGYTLRSPSP